MQRTITGTVTITSIRKPFPCWISLY